MGYLQVDHHTRMLDGRPVIDVVHWFDAARGCSRCAGAAERYIAPYFAPTKRVCPACCIELQALYDADGWPG